VKLIIWIVIGVAGLGVVAGLGLSMRGGVGKGPGGDGPGGGTPVRVETVGRGDLLEVVSAPGVVQPKTKVKISARVAARIV
jgi:multidrug efflux pump subunit AcrA (membrane-fusion protein)